MLNPEIKLNEILEKIETKLENSVSVNSRILDLENIFEKEIKSQKNRVTLLIILLSCLTFFNIFIIVIAAITQPPVQQVEQINVNK